MKKQANSKFPNPLHLLRETNSSSIYQGRFLIHLPLPKRKERKKINKSGTQESTFNESQHPPLGRISPFLRCKSPLKLSTTRSHIAINLKEETNGRTEKVASHPWNQEQLVETPKFSISLLLQ